MQGTKENERGADGGIGPGTDRREDHGDPSGLVLTGFHLYCRSQSLSAEYVKDVIRADKGELSVLEEQVIKSMKEQELLSKNINVEYDRQRSLGEIMADRLADFGGSWLFIGIFCGILSIWIVMNSIVMLMKPFDPYPYIFLNLILSCLAAMQAPVILMSQNRQEARTAFRRA